MARKPTDTAQLKLRIREDLRRRLEQAAKKRNVSLNHEMVDRLRTSFDHGELQGGLDKLGRVASDIEDVWDRFVRDLGDRQRMAELVNAAEHLIEQLPTEVREGETVKNAVEWVQEATEAIVKIHGRTYVHEPE
jgi:hypothetical protein